MFSVYNVYITNQFQTTCVWGRGVKSVSRGDWIARRRKTLKTFVPSTSKNSASGLVWMFWCLRQWRSRRGGGPVDRRRGHTSRPRGAGNRTFQSSSSVLPITRKNRNRIYFRTLPDALTFLEPNQNKNGRICPPVPRMLIFHWAAEIDQPRLTACEKLLEWIKMNRRNSLHQ